MLSAGARRLCGGGGEAAQRAGVAMRSLSSCVHSANELLDVLTRLGFARLAECAQAVLLVYASRMDFCLTANASLYLRAAEAGREAESVWREAEVRLWALADTHVETGATVVGAELACVALMELSASRALVLGVRVNPRRTRVNPFVSPSPGYCFLSFQGASLLISATLTWHPPISSLRSPLFTCPSRELIFHHYVFLPLLYSQRGRAVR